MLISETIRLIAQHFGVSFDELVSERKTKALMPARFAVYTILNKRGISASRIGRIMNRDHSTVLYGIKKFELMMKEDRSLAAFVVQAIHWRVAA